MPKGLPHCRIQKSFNTVMLTGVSNWRVHRGLKLTSSQDVTQAYWQVYHTGMWGHTVHPEPTYPGEVASNDPNWATLPFPVGTIFLIKCISHYYVCKRTDMSFSERNVAVSFPKHCPITLSKRWHIILPPRCLVWAQIDDAALTVA